jgi:hypothetical protein
MRVSEKRVLGRVFGPKREKVAKMKGKEKIHNEELHVLYSLTDLD